MALFPKLTAMPTPQMMIKDNENALVIDPKHYVLGSSMLAPFPEGASKVAFGMGCFWGAERLFWQIPGVITTAVGYAGGTTANPTYEQVCSGFTGQNEVVLVVFDPAVISIDALLKTFWENHNPTQGFRQGNDVGTQYRSAIYTFDSDLVSLAQASSRAYQEALGASGYGPITTEICQITEFFYAETYHQQYLAKNPQGYCGIGGTGVSCPVGLAKESN